MSGPIAMDRAQYAASLYRLLPALYRGRDKQGELQRFLALFADELWRMRARLEQQWRDQSIDSCQPWVIPYLAELVGSQVLFDDAARNRVDVKNTIRWRRRKGTTAGLGELAAGIGGGGALVAEMLERTAWMQNLVHVKREAVFAPDLRKGDAIAALSTPFSNARALVDLRRGSQRAGWYGPRKLGVFEWPLASYPLRHATPAQLGGGRYRFAPLGADTQLYAGGDKQAICDGASAAGSDICRAYADHVPIRTRDARSHPQAYVGTPVGFAIHEDGIPLVLGTPSPAAAATAPALDFAELDRSRGLVAADATLFAAPRKFTVEAVRLGAVLQTINGKQSAVGYSGGQPWAAQLQLRNAHGTLALDGVTPDFGYVAGVAAYEPDRGEFHHAVLLLRVRNAASAAAGFPESEIIARNGRGAALQLFLPARPGMAAAAELYLYAAADGSTYFARADHGNGVPDLNPDSSLFGAYAAAHLARAAEGQLRLRPGHAPAPNRWRRAVLRPLCCWDKPLVPPLASGEVAIDPERGRFAFPATEIPTGRLSVSYRYGFTGEVGAGPYARPGLAKATLTVAQTRNADHATLQGAINAAPNGGAAPVLIEILDSATYNEALLIDNRNFPGGLVLQAADQETPCVIKSGAGANVLAVQNSTIAELRLDGLVLSGGNIAVSGNVGKVVLRHCSASPGTVGVTLTSANANLQLLQSICGRIAITAAEGSLEVTDSIVQHPTAIAFANGVGKLERSTVIGDVTLHSGYLSNLLLHGALALADTKASCLRFSRLPRPFAEQGFSCTDAVPVLVSLQFGDAGYCHLHPNSAAALRSGAEEGGEIGAFHRAGLPWRTQNVAVRLAEYMPAGLEAVQIRVLPRPRFLGNRAL
jgi:hypothetical protein